MPLVLGGFGCPNCFYGIIEVVQANIDIEWSTLLTKMIIFAAKGSSDATVLISFCVDCDGFEIVIGGWGSGYSGIREFKREYVFDTKTEV